MAARVTPEGVIAALNRVGIKPVVMGTHGVGGWRSEARATQDVDVLVAMKDHRKAVRAVREAYPKLVPEDTPVVTRFTDPATDKVVIDVMKPLETIYRVAFRHSIPVGETHRVPDLEMALISKYAAMISPNRPVAKKYIDAGDFIDIVQHNRDDIDMKKLRQLAEKIYHGGGAEVVKYVEDAKAGRRLEL